MATLEIMKAAKAAAPSLAKADSDVKNRALLAMADLLEAAAQEIFDKSAAGLTRREASLIAACLPNPVQRQAGKPSAYVSRRAGQIRALIPKIAYPEWINHE